jgi:hypothetical protein
MISCLISNAALAAAPAFDSADWSSTSYFSSENGSLSHPVFDVYVPPSDQKLELDMIRSSTSVLPTQFNDIGSKLKVIVQLLGVDGYLFAFDINDELMMPEQQNALFKSIDIPLPKPDMVMPTWAIQQSIALENNQAYLNQPNHVSQRHIDN